MNIHTGNKPYKCPVPGCTQGFTQTGKLSMHKKLAHPELYNRQGNQVDTISVNFHESNS
jgi:uncharacterized Zn-finger protein